MEIIKIEASFPQFESGINFESIKPQEFIIVFQDESPDDLMAIQEMLELISNHLNNVIIFNSDVLEKEGFLDNFFAGDIVVADFSITDDEGEKLRKVILQLIDSLESDFLRQNTPFFKIFH